MKLHHPLWLLSGFWICAFIAIAVVVRRLITLTHPTQSGPPQMASMDAAFASHAALTAMHIIPASLFVIVAAAVLLRRTSSEWMDRLFFSLGATTGLTAYAMSAYAVGGWTERSAVFVFDSWFLVSVGCAWYFQRQGDLSRQREWMTRAVGILLGISTTRPVMGVFFATSARTHLSVDQFFGIAFWIGFSINAVVVELWLHSKRRAQLNARRLGDFSLARA